MGLKSLSKTFSADYMAREAAYERLRQMTSTLREATETGQSRMVTQKLAKDLHYYAQCYLPSEEIFF